MKHSISATKKTLLMILLTSFVALSAKAQIRFSGMAEVTYMEMQDGKTVFTQQTGDMYISLKNGYFRLGDHKKKVVAISKPTGNDPEQNYFIYFKEMNSLTNSTNEFEIKRGIYFSDLRTMVINWTLEGGKEILLVYKLKENKSK